MDRRFAALMRLWAFALAPFVLALAAYACAKDDTVRYVRVERATDLPRDVLFYPHVLYGGDAAYLAEGKWYRQGVDGWVVFTEEPVELEALRRALEPGSTAFLGW